MNVYILFENSRYRSRRILGVFSNREHALERLVAFQELNEKYEFNDEYDIEEYPLID